MSNILGDTKLDFQDVLIRPKRSALPSRDIDIERTFKIGPRSSSAPSIIKGVPIIAANMDHTGTFEVAEALAKYKCFTALTKHYPINSLVEFYNKSDERLLYYIWFTFGISDDDQEKFDRFCSNISIAPRNICLDVANGYQERFVEKVKEHRERLPYSIIMAGNIATPEMAEALILAGADIVKCGIGGGSVCLTRKMAGVGYPQLSAVLECKDAAHGLGGLLCSDGGCTCPGDVAKAFGAGADFVMCGGILAGHDECAGTTFYGMSSQEALDKHNRGTKHYRAPEGKSIVPPDRGPISSTIEDILGGIRSTMTYVGARRLKDLPKCTTFVKVNRQLNTVFGG